MKPTQHEQLQEKKLKAALWKRGELSFLLDATQQEMKAAFEASAERRFIFLCSRRLGKSHCATVIAFEHALRNPGSKVLYITSNFKAAKNIILPIVADILSDCPNALRPAFKTQDMKYVFKNGSEIFLYGSDRDPDNVRGQEADLIILDEAAFINRLDYLIPSVLSPMLLTTQGRILMATTPPTTTDHAFIKYLEEAEGNEAVITKTIYDCPRLSPKQIEDEKKQAGGETSSKWKTEYLCKLISNDDKQVVPEFTEEKQREIVQEISTPPFRDTYSSMDMGYVDGTGLLFGYWHFENAQLVIEDELLVSKETSQTIANLISEKEKDLWGKRPPFRRIADNNNPGMLEEFAAHGLRFNAVVKSTKEKMVNQLRLMIQNGQLVIHPRCKQLIAQLKYCRYSNSSRTEFARSASYGHYDLVDALIYLILSLARNRSPTPLGHGVSLETHFIPKDFYEKQVTNQLQKIIPTKFRKITRRKIGR